MGTGTYWMLRKGGNELNSRHFDKYTVLNIGKVVSLNVAELGVLP